MCPSLCQGEINSLFVLGGAIRSEDVALTENGLRSLHQGVGKALAELELLHPVDAKDVTLRRGTGFLRHIGLREGNHLVGDLPPLHVTPETDREIKAPRAVVKIVGIREDRLPETGKEVTIAKDRRGPQEETILVRLARTPRAG